MVKIIPLPSEIQTVTESLHQNGEKIGFVPTMGYLHEGHLALVRASKRETDVTVVSIFVNPTQFGPAEDLDRYPRDFAHDCELLESEGVDFLFAPEKKELYPEGFATELRVTKITELLCGASRPWHFPGVVLIVCKLFNLVHPQIAFFGQKDYQQCQVIKRMVWDLNFPIEIRVLPTVRETDGLAMSSRNRYLSADERRNATILFHSLQVANQLYHTGERATAILVSRMKEVLATVPEARIDYVEVLDAMDLSQMEVIERPAVAALAVFFGKTRLIDNHLLGEDFPDIR